MHADLAHAYAVSGGPLGQSRDRCAATWHVASGPHRGVITVPVSLALSTGTRSWTLLLVKSAVRARPAMAEISRETALEAPAVRVGPRNQGVDGHSPGAPAALPDNALEGSPARVLQLFTGATGPAQKRGGPHAAPVRFGAGDKDGPSLQPGSLFPQCLSARR